MYTDMWRVLQIPLALVTLVSTQKILNIGGFFALSGTRWKGGPRTQAPIFLAIDLINNNSEILPNYTINLIWKDTMASPTVSMRILFNFLYEKPTKLMLLGPNLSKNTVPVAEAASAWNLIQVSFSSRSAELIDKTRFPFLFSTLPNDNIYNKPRFNFIKHFGWKRVAILYEYNSANLYSSTSEKFVDMWKAHNYTVVFVNQVSNIGVTLDTIEKQEARILIGNFHFELARKIFCEVYKRKMYGPKYVWILLGWIGNKWWEYNYPQLDCTAEQIRIAQDGCFVTDLAAEAIGYKQVFGMTADLIEKYIVNKYAGYAFDAMMTVALTLDEAERRGVVIEDFSYYNASYVNVFKDIMSNIRFGGVTGTVAFEPNGNRIGTTVIQQSVGHSRRVVASYDPFVEKLQFNPNAPIVWEGGYVPLDGPIRTQVAILLPETTFISFGVVAALGMVLAIFFLGFNIKKRNLKYIKMSSPNMNNIIATGCIFAYIALVLNGLDSRLLTPYKHGIVCNVRVVVLSIGFTLSFGAMFCKTMRVHMIVNSKKTQKRIVKDIHLVYVIGLLLAVDTLIFMTWMIIDPLDTFVTEFQEKVDPYNEDYISQPILEKCSSKFEVYWVVSILFYKGLFLLFGLFLAWETRNIRLEALNDSKYIGLSVYNVSVICLIGVPVGYLIDETNASARYILSSMCIILCTTITQCLVFVPKIYGLTQNPGGEVSGKIHPTTVASTMNVGVSRDHFTERTSTQKRLETLLQEKENRIKELESAMEDSRT